MWQLLTLKVFKCKRRGIFGIEKADTGSGVRIILEYVCENGHRGEVILQFHKGIVFVKHNQLPPPMKDCKPTTEA